MNEIWMFLGSVALTFVIVFAIGWILNKCGLDHYL